MDHGEYVSHAERASDLVELGRRAEAIEILERLVEADLPPFDKAMMCLNIAIINDQLNQPEEALVHLERGLDYEKLTNKTFVALQHADYLARMGRIEESIHAFEAIQESGKLTSREKKTVRRELKRLKNLDQGDVRPKKIDQDGDERLKNLDQGDERVKELKARLERLDTEELCFRARYQVPGGKRTGYRHRPAKFSEAYGYLGIGLVGIVLTSILWWKQLPPMREAIVAKVAMFALSVFVFRGIYEYNIARKLHHELNRITYERKSLHAEVDRIRQESGFESGIQ